MTFGTWLGSLRHPRWALAIIIGLVFIELLLLPIGIDDLDEGYFAQQAQRVLMGQLPYRDFDSLYTPGLLYLHAAVQSLFGPHLLGLRALALVFRAATVVLLYVLARPVVAQPLWAAAPGAFLLLGLDDAPGRWEPHPGWPSTAAALLAVWCVAHSTHARWTLAAGLAAGLAYAFKQNTGVFILVALVLRDGRRALPPISGFVAVTVAWLVPLLLVIGGDWPALGPLIGEVHLAGLASPPEPTVVIPLACLAAGGWLIRNRATPRVVRWYLLAGACLFATEFPRSDSLHLAWSAPLLLVVAAVALSCIPRRAAAGCLVAAVLLCAPIIGQRVQTVRDATTTIVGLPDANGLRVPAATWSDLLNTVAEIQHRAPPDEPVFVYPTSPLLYLLAARPNPTRFDHLNPGAADDAEIAELIDTLRQHNVHLVVVGEFWRQSWGPPGANAALEQWLLEQFHDVAHFGQYHVLVRDL